MQDLILADMASLGIRDSQVLLICLIAAAAILLVIVRDYFRQLTAEADAAAETDADADFEAEVLAFNEVENDPAEERPFRQIVPQPMSAGQQFGRRRAA